MAGLHVRALNPQSRGIGIGDAAIRGGDASFRENLPSFPLAHPREETLRAPQGNHATKVDAQIGREGTSARTPHRVSEDLVEHERDARTVSTLCTSNERGTKRYRAEQPGSAAGSERASCE